MVFSSGWPANDSRGAAADPTPTSGSLNAPPPTFSRPLATPLDSLTKSTKLRPLIGSDSISTAVTTRLRSILAGSTRGGWLRTVTSSLTAPTAIVKSVSVVPPTVSTTPVRSADLKFWSSARISYSPGSSAAIR